jgi:hypothetical protein
MKGSSIELGTTGAGLAFRDMGVWALIRFSSGFLTITEPFCKHQGAVIGLKLERTRSRQEKNP